MPRALGAWTPNQWTAREVPGEGFMESQKLYKKTKYTQRDLGEMKVYIFT